MCADSTHTFKVTQRVRGSQSNCRMRRAIIYNIFMTCVCVFILGCYGNRVTNPAKPPVSYSTPEAGGVTRNNKEFIPWGLVLWLAPQPLVYKG